MEFDLIIRNGSVVRESGVEKLDLAIADEMIAEIAPEISGDARETIDATGLHVFPGVIDPHVHFNEPGRTEWEGISTGSAALAAGGGTLFFDMPLNSSPPVLNGKSFDLKLAAMREKSLTDFALWGGLTPNNLDRMEELANRGVVGFKAFMCDSGIGDFRHCDLETLEAGMRVAARLDLPVAVHAEEQHALERARSKVAGHSWQDYLNSRPIECEGAATHLAIECARQTGCSLHVVHVSSYFVLTSIEFARERGASVTCETCPHYLLLSDEDLLRIGAPAKCAPPLREKQWLSLFAEGVVRGAIDFIASDHSPAPSAMKQSDDAFAVWGGIAGVQSTLSAVLSIEPRPSLERVAALTSGNAASRFRIRAKGHLAIGNDADLALIGLEDEFELTRAMLLDRHKLSPYVGRTFHGRAHRTMVRGTTVFLDGRIVSKPIGHLIKPVRN